MKNREEIIKAIFSDEQKVQDITKDEEFLNKVLEGKATLKTYQKKFKKLGLDLTNDEINKIAEMINKILSTPVEQLPDLSLESIAGGYNNNNDNNENDNMQLEYKIRDDKLSVIEATSGVAGLGVLGAGVLTLLAGFICEGIGNKYENEALQHKVRRENKLAKEKFLKARKLYWMFPLYQHYVDDFMLGIN